MAALMNLIQYIGVFNLLTAVILCLLVTWFLRSNRKSYYNLPPGPPAIPYPFDAIMSLFPSKNRFGNLVMMNRRYGDLACLQLGKRVLIFISSPSMVKDLIVKQADVTSNRTVPPFFSIHGYAGGIIFSQGEPWQEIRRFSLAALRNFGMGKRSIEERIVEEANVLCQTIADFSEKPFDPVGLLNAAVSNIICNITFGKRFEYDDPIFQEMMARMRRMTTGEDISPIIRELLSRIPAIMKTPYFRDARENFTKIKDFINQEIDDHKKTYESTDIRDMIDTYLAEVRREKTPGEKRYLTDDYIWTCVFDLFLAGTETTSSSLMWLMLFMAGKPDIQKRVFDEIDRVVGRERAPRTTDRKDMPYTEATLLEVLRLRPVAPVGVSHVNSRDIEIRGHTIPSNTEIFINILAIHLDPTLWDDPEEFNPKRHLTEDESAVIKNEAFTVFGAGRRICLGEQLARMEFFLFATTLLQRFKFTMPDGMTADFSIDHCFGTITPKPYKAIAQKR